MLNDGRRKFVIVGAMKAGTTTLYDLLKENEGLYLPNNKEPNLLFDLALGEDKFQSRCKRLYAKASNGLLVGEASTSYAKFPYSTGIPALARQYYGDELRIIYILREPRARALSELNHYIAVEQSESALRGRIAQAYFNSAYSLQYERWLSEYPTNSILLLNFEQMISQTSVVLDRVTDFLGIPRMELPAQLGASNSTASKGHASNALVGKFLRSNFYLDVVKPKLGVGVRTLAKKALMSRNRIDTNIEAEYLDDGLLDAVVRQEDVDLWKNSRI